MAAGFDAVSFILTTRHTFNAYFSTKNAVVSSGSGQ
jgi:hypothetical protein